MRRQLSFIKHPILGEKKYTNKGYYYEELTMKEIGATLDLSESRVSQMHSAIVERLQNQLERRRPEFAM